jgi:hypothetical protein
MNMVQIKNAEGHCHSAFKSGRQDSNLRPLRPERSALPGCATARKTPDRKNSTLQEPGKIELVLNLTICEKAFPKCSVRSVGSMLSWEEEAAARSPASPCK